VICLDHKYEGKSAEEIYDELLTLNGRCGGSCLDEHPEIRTKYAIGDDDRVTVGEMTQQQRSVIERSIKSAVSRGMMAGDMSIGMRRIVGELCEPKLDWKTILASEITKLAGSGDYSFSPPDPLFFSGGMTLPVLALEEHVRVSIVIDASGSMSPRDINVVMSETKGLTSQYAGWEIQVMSFDSVLYEPVIYDDSDGDAIFSHRIDGGGGTCFGPPLEYIAGQKNPFGGKELVLFFTDGFTGDGWHEHLSHLNVLWLLNNRNSPPWGKAVRYDSYV
jgi:predicted metal-dependent peptidase